MDSFMSINDELVIKQCPDVSKGLGVFTTRNLSKGLRLLAETPLLAYESTLDAMEDIERSFECLSFFNQAGFIRLFAGALDVTPFLKKIRRWSERDVARVPDRLRQIVRFNSVEGQGIGCVLAILSSFLNHSCVPNAFLYWNDTLNAVTIHAVRNISKGEEVTISYFQESVSPASEERRAVMARLRGELSAYYKGAGEDQDGEIYVAMAKLRELASLFEEEGLYSLELSLVYVEQAQLFAMLGDDVGRRDKIRKAVQIRLLCLGTDHPSSAQLSMAIEREIRR